MSPTKRRWTVAAAVAALSVGSLTAGAPVLAQPVDGSPTEEQAPGADGIQHNVVYRARADGTSRGAVVSYKQDDANVNSAQPTMLPGQTFEVNAVLDDPKQAGMTVSIQWPYGSNLHCEILVDDQIVAQADQFIAPRLFRVKDDPLYGTLQCGAPLDIPVAGLPSTDADTAGAMPANPDAPPPPA